MTRNDDLGDTASLTTNHRLGDVHAVATQAALDLCIELDDWHKYDTGGLPAAASRAIRALVAERDELLITIDVRTEVDNEELRFRDKEIIEFESKLSLYRNMTVTAAQTLQKAVGPHAMAARSILASSTQFDAPTEEL